MKVDKKASTKQASKLINWKNFIIPLIIFIVALSIRIIGLKFDFPLFTHPDENFLMSPLIQMSAKHTLDPGTYVYPAFPSFYSNFFLLNGLSLLKFGMNYSWVYWQDPFFFFTATRWMTAIQGALIPVIAFLIGKKFNNNSFAIVSALLFTFYPPFVLHSHYVTVDIPLTLYIMLVLLFTMNYLTTDKKFWLTLASVMATIATLEKYPGLLSIGIILVAIGIKAFKKDEQGNKLGWKFFFKTTGTSALICILSVLVLAPQLLIHFDIAWKQIVNEARPTHLGADGLGWGGNILYYFKDFYQNSGLIILIFVVIGLIAIVLMKDPNYLLLLFGIGYWIGLSVLALHHSRWSLPMIISPLFLAAFGVSKIWQLSEKKKVARILVVVALTMVFLPFVFKGINTSIMLTWKDTRNIALNYMGNHGIDVENTVSDGYTPHYPNSKTDIFAFNIFEPKEKKYIVFSSIMSDRYAAEPERYIRENAFYNTARSKLELVQEFHPDPEPVTLIEHFQVTLEYLNRQISKSTSSFTRGPKLEIYKLPEN
ncbi:MAG: glycosyltransferase family 39 protein [Anaerolineaceae bacterium]|nr:glycosyltransferase family 39 protein [Anaerolineaceae bacterium]